MEGGAGDVVIAPFYVEDVLTPVSELVGDPVLAFPLVFHKHLVTGRLRTIDSNEENIVARPVAVHGERVLLADHGS